MLLAGLVTLIVCFFLFRAERRRDREREASMIEIRKYLLSIEGTRFFVYRVKQEGEALQKTGILDLLPENVNVVRLKGRKIEHNGRYLYIGGMVLSVGGPRAYPHLLRIQDGRVIGTSIYRSFKEMTAGNMQATELLNVIQAYFDSEDPQKQSLAV